ncbi:MAG TPA: hypothetical protein VIH04_01405 [Nitrosarchaeum sp.]
MIKKIIVIASILAMGIFVFSSEISGMFPNFSNNVIDPMKENVNTLGTRTIESVENGLDSSVQAVDETGNKLSSKINTVKESSKDQLSEKISQVNPIKSVDDIFKNEPIGEPEILLITPTKSNYPADSNFDSTNINSASTESNMHTIYEKLSLSMIQQSNGDVLLRYSDATGNTKSINVVIRTSDNEIFSGTFFTSNFKTVINDISRTYYVDVTVEHKDYGTVTSIFNSGDSVDSEINAEFYQQ